MNKRLLKKERPKNETLRKKEWKQWGKGQKELTNETQKEKVKNEWNIFSLKNRWNGKLKNKIWKEGNNKRRENEGRK